MIAGRNIGARGRREVQKPVRRQHEKWYGYGLQSTEPTPCRWNEKQFSNYLQCDKKYLEEGG